MNTKTLATLMDEVDVAVLAFRAAKDAQIVANVEVRMARKAYREALAALDAEQNPIEYLTLCEDEKEGGK